MRAQKEGNYTSAVVNEFLHLVISGLVTLNELKVLDFVYKHTICFKNTEKRFKRKTIYEALGMKRPQFYIAKDSLMKKGYLLEKIDEDDYYWYGLSPFKFNGLIVLNSKADAFETLNREQKFKDGYLKKHAKHDPKSMNFRRQAYDFHKDYVLKSDAEDYLSIETYTDSQILNQIFQMYISLNGLSALAAGKAIEIFLETNNPTYYLLEFIKLMQSQPQNARGLMEELKRAHNSKTDSANQPLRIAPGMYVVKCWNTHAKQHWHNLHHDIDMSEEAVKERLQCFQILMTYPLADNVVAFKKAGDALNS